MKTRFFIRVFIIVSTLVLATAFPAAADDLNHFELGTRGTIVTVDGEPTNDMLSVGLMGRYRLKDNWLVGFDLDYSSGFDVEGPAELLKIEQSHAVKTIDAKASAYTLSTWIEQRFGEKPEGGLSWFSTGGLGISFIDVDNAQGDTVDGGRFDIKTDPGTEFIFSVGAGPRYTFFKDWTIELSAKADYHIADWEMTDRVSGTKSSVDSYLALGGYLGISYGF